MTTALLFSLGPRPRSLRVGIITKWDTLPDYLVVSAKPRPLWRGYARLLPHTRNIQVARCRTVIQANRVNCQSGEPGPLPAETDGSRPTTGTPGGEDVVRIRSPSSQYPCPSLETGGNARANEGATAHQSLPRSRLSTLPTRVDGVRSMARPVSVPSKRRNRTYPLGRSPLLWFGRPGVCGATGGGVRIDWRRHTPIAPTWRSRTRYSLQGGSCLRGPTERSDTARRNPHPSGRGGCQRQVSERDFRPSNGESLILALMSPVALTRGAYPQTRHRRLVSTGGSHPGVHPAGGWTSVVRCYIGRHGFCLDQAIPWTQISKTCRKASWVSDRATVDCRPTTRMRSSPSFRPDVRLNAKRGFIGW